MKFLMKLFVVFIFSVNISCKKEDTSPLLTTFPATYTYAGYESLSKELYVKTQNGYQLIPFTGKFLVAPEEFDTLMSYVAIDLPFESTNFTSSNVVKLIKGTNPTITAPYKQTGNQILIGEGPLGQVVTTGFPFVLSNDLQTIKHYVYTSIGTQTLNNQVTYTGFHSYLFNMDFEPNITNHRNTVAQQFGSAIGDTIAVGVYELRFDKQ